MPTDSPQDELVVRLDANFFDGTLANAVLLIADYLSDPVEHAALHEAAGRLKWAARRIEAADKRIKALEAALKGRPSRWDYDRIASYDDAVRNWEAQAKAALGQGGVR